MLKKILVGVGLAAVGFAIGHTINVISKSRERPIAMVQPGDIIQWESSGKFILRVHESEMGIFVFVEGSSTGIPADQVVLINRG